MPTWQITYFYKGTLHRFTLTAMTRGEAEKAARKMIAAPITDVKDVTTEEAI